MIMSLEKHVAKLDDAHTASLLRNEFDAIPEPELRALDAMFFDVSRDGGETPAGAAEGANLQRANIGRAHRQAVEALLAYASESASQALASGLGRAALRGR